MNNLNKLDEFVEKKINKVKPDKNIFDHILWLLFLVRLEYYNKYVLKLKKLYKGGVSARIIALRRHRKTIAKLNKLKNRYGIKRPIVSDDNHHVVTLRDYDIQPYHIDEFNDFLVKANIELNDNQKCLLYNSASACKVVAGAGAGKSTVLGLRVLFLNKVLGVPLSRITVTTFTKMAKEDFKEKLVELYRIYSNEDLPKHLSKVVRTFHSIAYQINSAVFGGEKSIAMNNGSPLPSEEEDVDIVDPLDTPTYKTDPRVPKLSDILSYSYRKLYNQKNSDFKQLVNSLYRYNANSSRGSKNQRKVDSIESKIKEFDDIACEKVLNIWNDLHSDVIENLPVEIKPAYHQAGSLRLKYHFKLENINAFICLSLNPDDHKEVLKSTKIISADRREEKLSDFLKSKKSIVNSYASINYLIVESKEVLSDLIRDDLFSVYKFEETLAAPAFSYKSHGSIVSDSNIEAYEQMASLIDFTYSLGRSLKEITVAEFNNIFGDCSANDANFVSATKLFQEELEKELLRRNLISFNEIFHQLGNDDNIEIPSIPMLDHMLIDEFQDISPNIIKFLNRLKAARVKELKGSNENTSIIVVGDDCQSIYGWRGSAVQYIKEFTDFFHIPNNIVNEINLSENYRSAIKILDTAAKLFDPMKTKKPYSAEGPHRDSPLSDFAVHPPISGDRNDCIDYEGVSNQIREESTLLLNNKSLVLNELPVIYLLSALSKNLNNSKLNECIRNLPKGIKVKRLTIHKSKGLQAESIFILGDIWFNNKYPIKNGIYRWAGMHTTYDKEMENEKLRMAYVAITRAKIRCHWFVDNTNGVLKHFTQ